MPRYRWAQSAGRHGIGRDRARHVIEAALVAFPVVGEDGEPDPALLLFLGDDPNGVPLEIVVRLDGDVIRVRVRDSDKVMMMPKTKAWTAKREAALVAKAEAGFGPGEIGAPVPNPARRAGRPSMSPEGGPSKVLNARIPSGLHADLVRLAEASGWQVSEITRLALAALVQSTGDVLTAPVATPVRWHRPVGEPQVEPSARYHAVPVRPRVFLSYSSHDHRRAGNVARHLRALGLDVMTAAQQPGVVPMLDTLVDTVTSADAAVVVFTGDDRARASVLFEYGLLAGRLGPERVVLLAYTAADLPSDALGLTYIDASRPRALLALTRVLASLGLVAPEEIPDVPSRRRRAS